MEVSECSVSQGDELEKSRLGGASEGLWFNLLLRARTSPTPDQLSHGFGQISKTTPSASLRTHLSKEEEVLNPNLPKGNVCLLPLP